MTLAGGRVARSATESTRADLRIHGKRILRIGGQQPAHTVLDVSGLLILPGLINAHDHLEFNLFPRLGQGPYANAAEWANDIYKPREAPVLQHLKIPQAVRLIWGGLKNLLSGVTTVSHHNPYVSEVFDRHFPVRVVKRFGWAHSLQFCPDVSERYRRTPRGAPFIIHAGEGKNADARNEIFELQRLQVIGPPMVIVHAVAFDPQDIELIKRRGAALVWCPSSNEFTLGRTLSRETLNSGIPIALGSDSALTSDGDFIDELCAARRHTGLTGLYKMVTENAARILRLKFAEGSIREGGIADLVAVADEGQTPAEALASFRPELVTLSGRIKLFSSEMASRLPQRDVSRFNPIDLEGRGQWFTDLPVSRLAEEVKRELGASFRLAGRRVLV